MAKYILHKNDTVNAHNYIDKSTWDQIYRHAGIHKEFEKATYCQCSKRAIRILLLLLLLLTIIPKINTFMISNISFESYYYVLYDSDLTFYIQLYLYAFTKIVKGSKLII